MEGGLSRLAAVRVTADLPFTPGRRLEVGAYFKDDASNPGGGLPFSQDGEGSFWPGSSWVWYGTPDRSDHRPSDPSGGAPLRREAFIHLGDQPCRQVLSEKSDKIG